MKKAKRKAVLKQEGNWKKSKKDVKTTEFTYDVISKSKEEEKSETISEEPQGEEYNYIIKEFKDNLDLSKEQSLKLFFERILGIMQQQAQEKKDYRDEEEKINELKKIAETEAACVKIFKMLTKKKMPKEILKMLLLIKTKLLVQNYHEADQTYFTLTIGNSTWPTGSHAILDSDEKRSILQAIKRMMTFWTTKMFPLFITAEQKEEIKERKKVDQVYL